MNKIKKLNSTRIFRAKRVRLKIKNIDKPRLSVFKSNKYLYVQLIDDLSGKTLISKSSRGFKKMSQTEAAKEIGAFVAKEAAKNNIKEAVLDRGRYAYHGVVKALAESLRSSGLKI